NKQRYGPVAEYEHRSTASIKLPSSVFASEFEEEVGLLNKAAPVSGPRLDMDPDIVAALDEDFDFDNPENMLEDDFIIKANDFMFADCETKSRFTEYSLTSSVLRRNEQLTLLDDRFEKFYEQFDDDEIGALDNAELEGYIEPDMCATVTDVCVCHTDVFCLLALYNSLHAICINVYTCLQIRVSDKTGIPLDVLPKRGLTAKQVERMERINDSDLPRASKQPRSREESAEEKRARKQAIKTERKERRSEKKANKLAFKQEKQMQEKQMVNLRANVQGLKLS
uniref:Protein LTV1 homolog n=1 Tax=Sinocyclocheilus grahami TaxID=75366 RepID=A0A672KCN5_SINGR